MISKQTNHKDTLKRFMNISICNLNFKTTNYDLDNLKFCQGFWTNIWGEKLLLAKPLYLNGNRGV